MKILKKAENAFVLSLAPSEAQIFINSMTETIRRIPRREYWTRMGAKVDEINGVITSLVSALQ